MSAPSSTSGTINGHQVLTTGVMILNQNDTLVLTPIPNDIFELEPRLIIINSGETVKVSLHLENPARMVLELHVGFEEVLNPIGSDAPTVFAHNSDSSIAINYTWQVIGIKTKYTAVFSYTVLKMPPHVS